MTDTQPYLKANKTRNILQNQLPTQPALLPQNNYKIFTITSLSKKAEKTSQRLKQLNPEIYCRKNKLQNSHHYKLFPKKQKISET
jgi:hypothetical protein